MEIVEECTRFVFREYTDDELGVLRKLISANNAHYLYESSDWVGCPVGVERYIRKKFASVPITSGAAWDSAKMKFIPEKMPDPRDRLQKDALKFLREHRDRSQLGLIVGVGQGKAEPYSRLIPTPSGVTRMGDLKVGDMVFTQSGKPTRVVGIFEQGVQDVYEVTFSDGRTAECVKDHLWRVKSRDIHASWKAKTLEDIMKDYRRPNTRYPGMGRWVTKYSIPVNEAVEYPARDVPIDPWVLGCFIGNGCCREYALTISCLDDEIPNRIAEICGFRVKKNSVHNYSYTFYHMNGLPVHTKDFFREIPWMAGCYSSEKHIPEEYMLNTISVREKLLQGLMDTDGNISYSGGRYNVGYSSTSLKLLQQMQTVMWSLGWSSTLHEDKRRDKYRSGFCGSLSILVGNDVKPLLFTIKRKYELAAEAYGQPKRRYYDELRIVDIKLVRQDRCRCIMVDDPSHLYLTENFIVTHNTYMSIRHAIGVGEKTLIVLPTTAILDQWKSTLVDMFGIPEGRILHVNGTDRLSRMTGDWDWVLVLEQSLMSLMKNDKLEELLKSSHFGLKIIDEIHLFLRNNIWLDCCSNIKRTLYLTGTYFRTQEEETRLFGAVYGNILRFEVTSQGELEKYGQRKHINLYSMVINSRLTRKEAANIIIKAKIGRHTVQTVSVGRYMQTVCPDDGRITEYMRQSIAVVKRMRKDVPYGRMLILVPSIYATKRFRDILAGVFPDKKVGCINSTQTRDLNNQVKQEADIVVSTSKSCGVGFDMKDLAVLVAIEQFRSPVMVEQISGRLRPRSDGKDTYYVDIADSSLGAYLLRWRNERLDQLKKKSKSYKVYRVTG